MAVVAAVAVLGGAAWLIVGYSSVPDVVHDDRGFASGVLRAAGFEIEIETRPEADVTEGQVLSQDPEAGSRVRTGSVVTLTVAERPTHDLRGTFTLFGGSSVGGSDANCYGTGGYTDVAAGVTVTVRDGADAVLATGRLGQGRLSGSATCIFEFTVNHIPQSDFYAIEVGRRGELTYSHTELESLGWEVAFQLGQ